MSLEANALKYFERSHTLFTKLVVYALELVTLMKLEIDLFPLFEGNPLMFLVLVSFHGHRCETQRIFRLSPVHRAFGFQISDLRI